MSDETSGAGSMSVLEFIRADVDEWIQSDAAASPVLTVGARGWNDPTVQWDEECMAALLTVQDRFA